FQPAITVQFPGQKLTPPQRFRGALTFDKETCTACNLCIKACPTACIALEPAIDPATNKRLAKISWYQIDFGKCNYCRLCEEACPTKVKSVWHSLDYELVFNSRDEMVRCWRAGDEFMGVWYDRKTRQWRKPESQIPMHLVPAQKSY
ncbi:MAG: 4Fe-4S binding protein, partial [Elusimicrobia bacterium]|nr:4Fe-4S binding protein [Elusimicrobiota bacterium]